MGLLTGAIVVVVSSIGTGSPGVWAVAAVMMVIGAALLSPLPFTRLAGRASWADAEQSGGPVVLFRPGCPYCLRLRFALGAAADRATWIDIWADEAAAARVRAATGGDETVPTVLIDGEAHVNPEPDWVRSRLAS